MAEAQKHFVPNSARTCSVRFSSPHGGGAGSCYAMQEIPCPVRAMAEKLGISLLDLPPVPFSNKDQQIKGESPTEPVFTEEQIVRAAEGLPLELTEAKSWNPHDMKSIISGLYCLCTLHYPIEGKSGNTYKSGSSGRIFFAQQTSK